MRKNVLIAIVLLAVAGVSAWFVFHEQLAPEKKSKSRGARIVPVEVASIERGAIELRRSFTGTLEAAAEFVVAPKVSGRIEQLSVDLADTVTRGQVVARLDNDEYVQSVRQAEADLAVARANLAEAKSLLTLAERELQRIEDLRKRGMTSASQEDAAKADQLAKQAHVEVTQAQVARAEAQLQAARIRLSYTEVSAGWSGGNEQRVVAERYLDEGQTVSANAALLRIVELDPVTAVFFVTEQDYARLQPGQQVELSTDAYPDESFDGRIVRIAPVFRESTRQARVELRVANPELRLKPGMFVRATVVLEQVADATIVPEQALVKRDGQHGVFSVAEDGRSVAWRPVQVGIREGQRVQVSGADIGTQVVILGQQLLDDKSPISIAESRGGADQ
ncbi:MAG: RND transporter [Gammaproteobacteria bacterium SG8_47]|nr:MAG: RND transporter [Gammaproteobacteria bacterium SG8_47]